MRLVLIFAMALAGCATLTEEEPRTVISMHENILEFDGDITEESADEFFRIDKIGVSKIRLNSRGGDAELAIRVGYWIFDNKIDVEVLDYCNSSCANYLFPAGQGKFLHKDSAMVLHGGAFQKNFLEDYELDKVRILEEEFFQHIGVSGLITTYGQDRQVRKKYGTWWDIGFYYSKEDMLKVGIDNVILVDDTWDWLPFREDITNIYRPEINLNSGDWLRLSAMRSEHYELAKARVLNQPDGRKPDK